MRWLAGGLTLVACLRMSVVGFAVDPPAIQAQTDSLIREEFATDDTGMALQSARGAFLEVDAAKAGERIRTAAKQLRDHAATLAVDSRDSLHEAAHDLDKLAVRVEERGIQSVREFDNRLARAFHTIAQHHVDSGRVAWQARVSPRRPPTTCRGRQFGNCLEIQRSARQRCYSGDDSRFSHDFGKAHRG